MIASIALSGFGPHENTDVTLNPEGTTVVEGPSESGKSTMVDAVCFVLDGSDRFGKALPVDVLRDGAKGAEVSFTLKNGTVLRRRMTRSRSVTRERVGKDGASARFTTEQAWRVALNGLGTDPELVRVILAPLAWVPLAQGEGGGRPLRDLLVRALSVDTTAWLSERLHDGEPRDTRQAEAWRRDARRSADNADGVVKHARDRLARLEAQGLPEVPSDAAVAAARQRVEDAGKARDAWQKADARWRAATSAHRDARDAAEAWEERAGRVATEPTEARPTHEALTALRKAEAEARRALEETRAAETQKRLAAGVAVQAKTAAIVKAADALGRAEESAERLEEVPCGGKDIAIPPTGAPDDGGDCIPCSSCPLLTDAVAARDSLDALRAALTTAEAMPVPAYDADEWQRTVLAADVTHRQAVAAREAAEAIARAWSTYETARDALGVMPTVPEHPGDRPDEPIGADSADVQLVETAQTAALVRETAAKQMEEARADLARCEADAKALREDANRADEVVDLLRRAPGEALRAALSKLDAGPVSITVPEDGAALDVQIDGRPWWLASTGRRIVADLHLRAALRAACGRSYLPLFVDEVQSVGGMALPDVGGPVVLLRTTNAGSLQVVAAPRAA